MIIQRQPISAGGGKSFPVPGVRQKYDLQPKAENNKKTNYLKDGWVLCDRQCVQSEVTGSAHANLCQETDAPELQRINDPRLYAGDKESINMQHT